ncbi:unnamed protein product [marine sediment metagenome]|uniref:Peptidase S49 domain-containing protein n=1 Tax=marine sediment metagenome TaxID=412755 RepID=X0SF59_9ZZZZ
MILMADEVQARMGRRRAKIKPVQGGVTVLPLHGILSQRMNMMSEMSGGTSYEEFGAWFDAAVEDEAVGAIVLDVDSPGGSVYGLEELSAKMYAARGRKPIVAVANAQAASAAYYVGSSAKQFVVTPSGEIGSIGVVSMHVDVSAADEQIGLKRTIISTPKFKAEGNPYEVLSKEARDHEQGVVDDFYGRFVADVARNRNTTKADVEAHFGQGRMVLAEAAVAAGMADRVATLAQVLTDLGVKVQPGRGMLGAVDPSVDIRRRREKLRQH